MTKKLINEKDKNLIDSIKINDKYEISLNSQGHDFLANLSAGQKHLVSLSFIYALAKIANENNEENTLSIPLIMDTPFGRLSSEHRKSIIENVPQFCSQWILLVTDTELEDKTKSIIKNTNYFGKYYEINKKNEYISIIENKTNLFGGDYFD
ncbi:hypothetical protein OF820_06240 [Oceanotoga sp. DSM 15011]|uniref:hypothetical protein n=1 Tax=Oceanotoga sp. DSM 15011 TaxID=2984951 RepID=UPI0021F4C996|nr:hypothetical protein [Oceanotoga sp. DSM 15011]UYP01284.1 hypothetical protein OF820_06240 [Oceanotoga sp. DSM 15011]